MWHPLSESVTESCMGNLIHLLCAPCLQKRGKKREIGLECAFTILLHLWLHFHDSMLSFLACSCHALVMLWWKCPRVSSLMQLDR